MSLSYKYNDTANEAPHDLLKPTEFGDNKQTLDMKKKYIYMKNTDSADGQWACRYFKRDDNIRQKNILYTQYKE